MTRLRVVGAAVVATMLAGVSLALANSLAVSSQRLTVGSSVVSVPKSVVSISQNAVGGAPNTAHTTTATLTGGTAAAGGSLTFTLFPGGTCTGTAVVPGPEVINPINGAAGQSYTSAARTPTSAGTYSWLAAYSGDANNASATNCRVITVTATATLHVSAISVVSRAKNASNGKWEATLKVEVRDAANALVGGVVVAGAWTPTGRSASQSGCTTVTSGAPLGTCEFYSGSNSFPNDETSQTWTVTSLTKAGYTYDAGANTVSSIVVTRP